MLIQVPAVIPAPPPSVAPPPYVAPPPSAILYRRRPALLLRPCSIQLYCCVPARSCSTVASLLVLSTAPPPASTVLRHPCSIQLVLFASIPEILTQVQQLLKLPALSFKFLPPMPRK